MFWLHLRRDRHSLSSKRAQWPRRNQKMPTAHFGGKNESTDTITRGPGLEINNILVNTNKMAATTDEHNTTAILVIIIVLIFSLNCWRKEKEGN